MSRVNKWQKLYRILIIPWVILLSVVIGMYSSEQYQNIKFVDWLDVNNTTISQHKLYLKESGSYRLVLFVHKKEMFDKNKIIAETLIHNMDGKIVARFDFTATGKKVPAEGVIGLLLGKHVSELVDDRIKDPYNHNKFIRSTSVFKVDKTDNYLISTYVKSHPPSWEIALLLNVKATSVWFMLTILLLAYLPIFIIQEIYYFIERVRARVRGSESMPVS